MQSSKYNPTDKANLKEKLNRPPKDRPRPPGRPEAHGCKGPEIFLVIYI